jgi:hypothetical protein
MKINIELNPKSIHQAIAILKKQKTVLVNKAIHEFMELSSDWIINRANEILDRSDIGENIKNEISDGWDTKWIAPNHLEIINHSRKAVYVEFGVGIIGQTDKHPNADEAGYEYNVESSNKFGQGFWQFTVPSADYLDLPQKAIINQDNVKYGISIITQGTEGVWYFFNAVEDFKLREQQRLWEKIKNKYWS